MITKAEDTEQMLFISANNRLHQVRLWLRLFSHRTSRSDLTHIPARDLPGDGESETVPSLLGFYADKPQSLNT